MSNKPKLLLIDADYAPYAFGGHPDFDACVKTSEWLEWLYEKRGTRDAIIFISGPGNFRYRIGTMKPYKGNRADKEKPESYLAVREHLKKDPKTIEVHGTEADDAIIMVKKIYQDDYDCEIVSDDKDMVQEVGKHFRHSKNIELDIDHEIVAHPVIVLNQDDIFDSKTIWVTEYYGDFRVYQQMLIGDSSDNIPGVPGIGKSNKIFKEEFVEGITVDEARAIVWKEYLKYYGLNAVDAYLEQYRLLRLMNNPEIIIHE